MTLGRCPLSIFCSRECVEQTNPDSITGRREDLGTCGIMSHSRGRDYGKVTPDILHGTVSSEASAKVHLSLYTKVYSVIYDSGSVPE